ncbi:hypothetical protein QFC22_005423 [Naganishia vaughanmartiniae]|uniref:Uncharacterized protein n=1 Tax=Naganishia vaughanmartiniae TaxID=1424756 RepID=A0ACC2WVA3_9TREE|nr:hypothetical protein QFC22_005423 [Naganishia vaughanmartiniae]
MDTTFADPFARFPQPSGSKPQPQQQQRYLTPPFSPPSAKNMLVEVEKTSLQHGGSAHMSLPPQAFFAQTSPMLSHVSAQSMSSRIPTYQGRQHSPLPIGSAPLSPPAMNDQERRDFAVPSQSSGQAQYSSQTGPSPPLAAVEMQKRATYNPTTATSGSGVPSRHSSMYTKEQVFSPEYTLHPSIAAYQVSHPRRQLINFGPYILLQTLGEGEFGKVKLGVHREYGEEVAIKLIRRGSVDNAVRLSKVEREIDVLKTVKHPNIVRLFDVIETEKYIGIILDFANGGELFDHILAHRYLKEKDASKLFAQLISGVHYLHQKNIVHRDLKLENLLLDKHRNVIITDFGFANRFEHRQDDLMATSCGSPCYAAPELVVSDGLYVGSAVDIWSCGVILYAMLSGYLPFDDDPENPDGDNINLLYKYIINTPLTFPDWISPTARDLMSSMLVPNPEHRCTLTEIMNHPWLIPFRPLFARSVDELESIAQEQMQYKRQTSRKDMQARMKARETARLNYLAQSAGVAPGQVPQKSKVAPQDHQRRHKSDMPTMGMGMQSAPVSVPQGPRPIATAAGIATSANQEFRVPPHPARPSDQTSSALTTAHSVPPSGSLPAGSAVQNGTRPRTEEDTEVDPILAEGEVRASARQRADDGRQTSTVRMGEVTPKRSDGTTTASSNDQTASPGSGSPASKKRPSPQTKNRHTIQVEYDGEAAYARLLEIQADKDRLREAKATPAVKGDIFGMQIDEVDSTPTLPKSQMSPIPRAPMMTYGEDSQSEANSPAGPISQHSGSPEKMDVEPTIPASLQQSQQQPGFNTAPASGRRSREADSAGNMPMPASPTLSPSFIRLVPPTPSKQPAATNTDETGSPHALHKKAHSDTALQPEHRPSQPIALLPVPSRTASGSSVSDSISSANTQSSRLGPPHPRPRVSIDTDARQHSSSLTASLTLAETSPGVNPGSHDGVAAGKVNAKKERNRKGMTLNSFGFGKLLSGTGMASDTVFNSGDHKEGTGFLHRRESTRDKARRRANAQRTEDGEEEHRTHPGGAADSSPPIPGLLHTPATTSTAMLPTTPREGSTRSRNSSVMVHGDKILPPHPAERSASNASVTQVHSFRNNQSASVAPVERPGHQHTASSSAAQKVMNWFRRKSVAKGPFVAPRPISREPSQVNSNLSYPGGPGVLVDVGLSGAVENTKASGLSDKENVAPVPAAPQQRVLDQVDQRKGDKRILEQQPTTASRPTVQARDSMVSDRALLSKLPRASTVGNDLVKQAQPPINSSVGTFVTSSPFNEARLRVHVGVVDQSALTSKPAVEVMDQVQKVLHSMGIEVKRENDFKLRCTRTKRRKAGAVTGMGSSTFSSSSIASMAMGTTASNNVYRSGLPSSYSSAGLLPASGGFRNILMRRGSSQNAIASVLVTPDTGATITSTTQFPVDRSASEHRPEPIYGEHT